MTKPIVFGADGSPVALGERIGRGGEGEVYALAGDPKLAAKIYSGAGGATRRDKIAAMVSAKLSDRTTLASFPMRTVHKRNGDFAGFIMRRISGHRPLFELYAPGARKTNFPQANYPFLVLTALNFANAVGKVHSVGCVIGDINHSGILIADNALVSLIDADSFQLIENGQRYLCRVGVPDYTPPELQGVKLDQVIRTPNHDDFGVAIVLFQLLFMGRHPFSGSYQHGEMPIEKAIGEHRFAYGTLRNVGMKPPPAAPLLKHFPPSLGAAFEAAFGPSGVRPEPRQWIRLLDDLKRTLRVCRSDPLHHYWEGAPECPWCRMERLQGISLFLPPIAQGAGTAGGMPGGTFRAEVIWQRIEAVASPGACSASPRLQAATPSASADAETIRSELWKQRGIGAAATVAGGFILLANAGLWFLWVPAGWFGLAKMFGGADGASKLRTRKADLDKRWNKSLADWRSRCGEDAFLKMREGLYKAKTDYQGLAAEQSRRVLKYQQNRQQVQLQAFLSTFTIRRAKISGIGPSKTATLASYGIDTAADVTSVGRIEQVPGFGPTTAYMLMGWRRTVEAKFRYNPNPNQADQVAMNRIKGDIARMETQLRHQLTRGPEELRKEAARAVALRQTPDAQLQRLHEELAQAEADLALVDGKLDLSHIGGWIAAILFGFLVILALANVDWTSSPTQIPAPVADTSSQPSVLDDLAANSAAEDPLVPVPDEVTSEEVFASTTSYAVRETNVRAKPSTSTAVIGKLGRGAPIEGVLVSGLTGQKPWLKVTSGPYKGFYVSAAANLSNEARPSLSTALSGRMAVMEDATAYREASYESPALLDLPIGTRVDVVGTTANGFAEVSLKSGAIGYVFMGVLGEAGSAPIGPAPSTVDPLAPQDTVPPGMDIPGAVVPPSDETRGD